MWSRWRRAISRRTFLDRVGLGFGTFLLHFGRRSPASTTRFTGSPISTVTSERYPETWRTESASSKARGGVGLRRCANVRGADGQFRPEEAIPPSLEFNCDGDAARCQSATICRADANQTTRKRHARSTSKIHVFRLWYPFWLSVIPRREHGFRKSGATIIGNVASRGSASKSGYEGRQDRGDAEIGACRGTAAKQGIAGRMMTRGAVAPRRPQNHRPPERRTCSTALPKPSAIGHHDGQPSRTGHQARTADGPMRLQLLTPWSRPSTRLRSAKVHAQDGVCHGHPTP